MKIVAFLQCLWVKQPERVAAMLDDHEKRYPKMGRERMLERLLFIGGRTGQVLTDGLGDEWCSAIVWEESTRKIAGHSSGSFPPDLVHMRAVLDKHQPDVVITFGKVAYNGIDRLFKKQLERYGAFPIWIEAPHPVARGVQIVMQLAKLKGELNSIKRLKLPPSQRQ